MTPPLEKLFVNVLKAISLTRLPGALVSGSGGRLVVVGFIPH